MRVIIERAYGCMKKDYIEDITKGLNVTYCDDLTTKIFVEVNTLDELFNVVKAVTKKTECSYVEGGLILKSMGNEIAAIIYDDYLE